MVSVPSRQDFVLEPYRHRAAAGADGEAAGCAQRQRRAHRRAFSWITREPRPDAEGAATESVLVLDLPRRRYCVACDRAAAVAAATLASTRDRSCRCVGRRAPQWRGRARRDFSGDGEQRDDVRRAWASGKPPAARYRARVGGEAAGRARARSLLPALRLADLGYRACLPRFAGGRG